MWLATAWEVGVVGHGMGGWCGWPRHGRLVWLATSWEVGVVGHALGISSSPLTAVVVMALRAGREHFTVSTRALSKVW